MTRHDKDRTLLEITPALRAALEEADRSGRPLSLGKRDGLGVTGADFDRDLLAMFPGTEEVPGVRRLGVMARGKTFPFSRFPDLEVVALVNAGARHVEELGRLRKLHWLSLWDATATHLDPLARALA